MTDKLVIRKLVVPADTGWASLHDDYAPIVKGILERPSITAGFYPPISRRERFARRVAEARRRVRLAVELLIHGEHRY